MDTKTICVFCEGECQPAPTERGWVHLRRGQGLHYDCADHAASCRIDSAPRLREAAEENARLSELLWGARCIHCGEVIGADKRSQDVSDELLKQHIETCPKHPVSILRQELAEVKEELEDERMESVYQTSRVIHVAAQLTTANAEIAKLKSALEAEKGQG